MISKLRGHAGTILVAGVVLLSAALTAYLGGHLSLSGDQGGDSPRFVQAGGDYFVSVPLVEVAAEPAEGEAWDSIDDSAPDPYVEILWRGKVVFQSSTKEDTFIAGWSNAAIDLTEIATSMGKTSIDEVIKAARITIAPDEVLSINIYDSDPFGKDDLIGKLEIPVERLVLGDDTKFIDDKLKRIIVRTRSMKETPDLFQ